MDGQPVTDEILRESVGSLSGSKLDRSRCVLRDVRLCGFKSKHGRDYSRDGLRKAVPLYEGLPVYLNHPQAKDVVSSGGKPAFMRDVKDKFGIVRNARWDSNLGPIGDLHYNGGHPLRESFEWAADNDPSFYALSHNAEGKSRPFGNGQRLVESITRIHSVDLVDTGATTGSLHESETTPMNWRDQLAQTIAAIVGDESLSKDDVQGKLKHLVNALPSGDGDGDESGDAPGDGDGDEPMNKPEPSEAMESVRVAYPNDPNVAVLLECATQFLGEKKLAEVRKWAKSKGIPDDRLTEGVVTALSQIDETLRESFVVSLASTGGVKAAPSSPVVPTKVAPAASAAKKKPSLDIWKD